MGKPKGLKDVMQAGMGAAESILGVPGEMKTIVYVGLAVVALVVVVMVGTMCWGVGSGKINVNELARSGADISANVSKMH